MEQSRVSWGSRFGFIMATAGFSVGLGNIWRFPYLTGMNGGGVFVLVYVIICAVICVPLFIAEVGLGRKTQKNPLAGIRSMTKKGSPWESIGWLGAIICIVLMAYYMVIVGWMISYTVKMITGTFNGMTGVQINDYFDIFQSNTLQSILFTLVVVVILGIISSKGLKNGIEKACKVMMPALIIMLIILAVRSLTLPNSMEGLKWYLTPDFSKFNMGMVLAALGQAFFSIGIGCSCAFTYGSFLNKDSNLPKDACTVIGLDMGIALLAGVVIFPALFSFNMEPGSGMGLVFKTMPQLFVQLPMGNLFGAMFFLLVAMAGFTSAIGYLEGVTTIVEEEMKVDRRVAVWGPLAVMFILSIPCSMSLNGGALSGISIMGKNLFDFADYLTGNVLMTINSLLISLFTIFVWKFNNYRGECNNGATLLKVAGWWKVLVCFIVPIAVAYITFTNIF